MSFDLGQELPYVGFTLWEIIWALVILIVGIVVVKVVVNISKKGMKKAKLPPLLIEFLGRFLGILLYIVVLLLFAGALGFNVNSIVLGLSAILGLILAFGLQDSFLNMSAGFWIALIRPFRKDDVVSAQGMTGKIQAVGIMATELLTPDNTYITIPNKILWSSPITNFTKMPIRRVDVNVGVSYATDLNKAIRVAMEVMNKHSLVVKTPEPTVVVTELGDSSINLQLRPWSKTDDYWTVKGDITKQIYETYSEKDIEIPFPQMDVHLKKE